MVTDQEISQALNSLLQDSNPSFPFTSLDSVVQALQSNLRLDLSSKLDFIRSQIHLHYQPHPQIDPFAPQRIPNFPQLPSPSPAFQFHGVPTPVKPDAVAESHNASVSSAEASKPSNPTKAKRRGGPGGLNKLCGVTPELQVIVGQPEMPRTEIVKQLWAYIRKNNLQDPSNKRKIICNDELRLVFETDCTDMFKMNKLLAKHIISLEPSKQPSSKKPKVELERKTQNSESAPSVIMSDALASFFGVAEKEMLQAEVYKRLWAYIKVNHLEDPSNSMVILCDEKFRELFGCESISALGIPEVLARHHIFRKPTPADHVGW